MRLLVTMLLTATLLGCSTVDKAQTQFYTWMPKDHDVMMFDRLVSIDLAIERINCDAPDWFYIQGMVDHLERYAEYRYDQQLENLQGLSAHITKLSTNTNPVFCKIGKKTANSRIDAVAKAWRNR